MTPTPNTDVVQLSIDEYWKLRHALEAEKLYLNIDNSVIPLNVPKDYHRNGKGRPVPVCVLEGTYSGGQLLIQGEDVEKLRPYREKVRSICDRLDIH